MKAFARQEIPRFSCKRGQKVPKSAKKCQKKPKSTKYWYRTHTIVKNAWNMKSVSQAKLAYFEGIFKLWTHEQQELPFRQMSISFSYQNLAVLCVKRPWNGFHFSWKFWCCMRSIMAYGRFLPLFSVLSTAFLAVLLLWRPFSQPVLPTKRQKK